MAGRGHRSSGELIEESQMNEKISIGEKFVDCDGDELQVLRIGDNSIVLRSPEQELLVVDIDDVLQDLASGDLVRLT